MSTFLSGSRGPASSKIPKGYSAGSLLQYTPEQLIEHFDSCTAPFRGLNDGKFYYCHLNTSAVRTNLFPLNDNDYINIDTISKEELIKLCKEQLDKYINKRGIDNILQHRKKSSGYISGSIRYEVLKRAKRRCELCGISANEKALEVDHIIPRSKPHLLPKGIKVSSFENIVCSCVQCNSKKADKTLKEAKMSLIKTPRPISKSEKITLEILSKDFIPEEWKPYIKKV